MNGVSQRQKNTDFTENNLDWFNDFEKGNDGKHITIGCLGQDCLDFGIIGLGIFNSMVF